MFFDTHMHGNHPRMGKGYRRSLEEAYDRGVTRMLCVPITLESNDTIHRDLGEFPGMSFAAGLHPNCVSVEEASDEWIDKVLRQAIAHYRPAAIGETGLDYHYENPDKERQALWFRRHIGYASPGELAGMGVDRPEGLPLILHIRDAYEDGLKILREESGGQYRGVLHCFAADFETAMQYIELGFHIGISGDVTYPEKEMLREAVRKMPLERIVLETDCPFKRPAGVEKGPNTPLYIPAIAREVAEIKGVPMEEVERVTWENGVRLFGE